VKIGIHIPQWGTGATRGGVLDVARAAEESGLDSVWVSDHIVFPLGDSSTYPYQKSGSTPFSAEDGFLEAFTMLAAIAGATERVTLGTSVLVLPMRHPLFTAKTVATLDVLSGGRVLLALGAGWWAEEFAALGADFAGRGRAFEESIDVLRMLWAGGEGGHDGEFFSFPPVASLPRPVQAGGPPLLIGGASPRARRRAGEVGDGWHAIGSRVHELTAGMAEVREHAAAAGRDPEALMFSTVTRVPKDAAEAERFVELRDAGIHHVVMGVPSEDPAEICRRIEQFANQALPLLGREERAATGR
jgi:probable F420-dependent oxidoreductase